MKVDARIFNKRMKELSKLPEHLLDEALDLVKEYTPKDSGYAQRNVKRKGNSIVADYPYAGRLDDGYSRQAPNGFTEPTIEQLHKETNNFVRKV